MEEEDEDEDEEEEEEEEAVQEVQADDFREIYHLGVLQEMVLEEETEKTNNLRPSSKIRRLF